MTCCNSFVKYLKSKLFYRQESTLPTDLSKGVQQPNNELEKRSPAPSIDRSEDEDHHTAALDTDVLCADFCPDDDDVSAPNPLALACSRAIAQRDPPWPKRQEFEQRRAQEMSTAP